ncbi:MAG: SRPBCC domain-containing protein [Bacteroidota bacterium]
MKSISTEITINAPVEQVWAVLTNFSEYPQWNPFIQSISGEAKEGSQLEANIQPPGQSAMTFRPTVLRAEENQEFRWLGKLLIKGIFDGEHYFLLTAIDERTTQFEHGEHFRGLLSSLILTQIAANTVAGFEAMNEALKTRAEALS